MGKGRYINEQHSLEMPDIQLDRIIYWNKL